MSMGGAPEWFYLDQAGEEQGPFPAGQLRVWYAQQMFPAETKVKKTATGEFTPMNETPAISGPEQVAPMPMGAPPMPMGGAPLPMGAPPMHAMQLPQVIPAGPMPAAPEDEDLKARIEKLAEKGAENPALIAMISEKKKDDPGFAFLQPTGDGHAYYLWCMASAIEHQTRAVITALQSKAAMEAAQASGMGGGMDAGMGGGGGMGGGAPDGDIQLLVDQRDDCRRNRDWDAADEIRGILRGKGVQIEDQSKSWTGPDGTGGQVNGGAPPYVSSQPAGQRPRNAPWRRGQDSGDNVDGRRVENMLRDREDARKNRDFNTADGIREELNNMGVRVDDQMREWTTTGRGGGGGGFGGGGGGFGGGGGGFGGGGGGDFRPTGVGFCLLYTSDAADEEDSVDLGGSRVI
eukprot:TRINITY_DN32459_c0_g1_i2.p1 TRINITY_DN32459_c0_g1~~TRINITY_DN32459_c0_g1_i2.p1  ORF type:complete len:404 (+),score=96.17 TRINITY_DN32459_c0_g1_i2:1262-2473(+)